MEIVTPWLFFFAVASSMGSSNFCHGLIHSVHLPSNSVSLYFPRSCPKSSTKTVPSLVALFPHMSSPSASPTLQHTPTFHPFLAFFAFSVTHITSVPVRTTISMRFPKLTTALLRLFIEPGMSIRLQLGTAIHHRHSFDPHFHSFKAGPEEEFCRYLLPNLNLLYAVSMLFR